MQVEVATTTRGIESALTFEDFIARDTDQKHVSDTQPAIAGDGSSLTYRWAVDKQISAVRAVLGQRLGKWTRLPTLWLGSRVLRFEVATRKSGLRKPETGPYLTCPFQ